jgi:predicted DNA binding CopG/RHH family protein
MTDAAARARRDAIRADYADEEAENAEAEALENAQSVLSVRVPTQLAESLKERAASERIPTSALVRRLLTNGMHARTDPVLTVEQVEEIARRVMHESADH